MTPASLPAWDLNWVEQAPPGPCGRRAVRWVGIGARQSLGDAMRYAVLDGGKRLRPARAGGLRAA